jgi:hypothetical protein
LALSSLATLCASEQPVEKLPGALADFPQRGIQALLVQMFRRPAFHQVGEHLELRRGGGKAALRVARGNALAVIQRAVEGGRLTREVEPEYSEEAFVTSFLWQELRFFLKNLCEFRAASSQ